jgi:hypothetical protein
VVVVVLIAGLVNSSPSGPGTANISKVTSEKSKEKKVESKDKEKVEEPKAKSKPKEKSPDTPVGGRSEEAALEDTLRKHYAALDSRDFKKAYSYFSSAFRGQHSEQDWSNDMKSLRMTGVTVNSVTVNGVSGDKATAAVDYTATLDYSLPNGTRALRQLDTWRNLTKEDGQWKLDEQVSHEVID